MLGSLRVGIALCKAGSMWGSLRLPGLCPGVLCPRVALCEGSLRAGVASCGASSVRGSLQAGGPGAALSEGCLVEGSLHFGVPPSGGRSVRGSLSLGVALFNVVSLLHPWHPCMHNPLS